jgi:DHA1 family tetracycline resistance protein-like MFS transporter
MSSTTSDKPFGLHRVHPLFIALIINAAAHSYFTITFPALGRELNLTDLNSSLVLSISALVMMVSAPFWGWLCESWGRKKVIIIGLCFSILSSLSFAAIVATNIQLMLNIQLLFFLLLGIRVAHTAFSAGIQPASQAMIADITVKEKRTQGMGMMGAAFGLGTIIGGIMALTSGSDHLVAGFLFVAALLSSTVALLALRLKETVNNNQIQIKSTLPIMNLFPLLLTTLLGLSVYSALQQITSWRLQDGFGMTSHHSVQFTGAIMMATMLAMIVTQGGLVAKLSWPATRYRLTGAMLITLAMTISSIVPNAPLLLISMCLMGVGLGMLLPSNLALLSLAVSRHQQGQIAGVNGIFQGLGLALGPVTGSLLYAVDIRLPYILAAILFLLLTVHAWSTHTKQNSVEL